MKNTTDREVSLKNISYTRPRQDRGKTVWGRGEAEPVKKNCLEAASSRGRCRANSFCRSHDRLSSHFWYCSQRPLIDGLIDLVKLLEIAYAVVKTVNRSKTWICGVHRQKNI